MHFLSIVSFIVSFPVAVSSQTCDASPQDIRSMKPSFGGIEGFYDIAKGISDGLQSTPNSKTYNVRCYFPHFIRLSLTLFSLITAECSTSQFALAGLEQFDFRKWRRDLRPGHQGHGAQPDRSHRLLEFWIRFHSRRPRIGNRHVYLAVLLHMCSERRVDKIQDHWIRVRCYDLRHFLLRLNRGRPLQRHRNEPGLLDH